MQPNEALMIQVVLPLTNRTYYYVVQFRNEVKYFWNPKDQSWHAIFDLTCLSDNPVELFVTLELHSEVTQIKVFLKPEEVIT
jgi:hypothetical protein